MRFCLVWFVCTLHALWRAHFRVHIVLRDAEDVPHHYLVCGCGRVFWPPNWRELEDPPIRLRARRAALLRPQHYSR